MEKHFHKKPNTVIGRTDLNVADVNRSAAFYEQVLGFRRVEAPLNQVWLSADGKNPLLVLKKQKTARKLKPVAGLYHFALLLPERKDLAALVRRFLEIGLRFGSSDHLVSEALYLNDPDGNGIEVYIDRPSGGWKWADDEVMMTVDPLDFDSLLSEEPDGVWGGLPGGTVMGHLHLQVSDLHRAEEFYTDGLGFQTVSRYGEQARFLSAGRYHHHLGLNTWAGEGMGKPEAGGAGLARFTVLFSDDAARQEAAERLQHLGYSVRKTEDGLETEDPSSLSVLLSVYPLEAGKD